MVEVNLFRTEHGHYITGKGHAHEAHKPDGNLVCAAVSTIAQSLAYYIYQHEDRAAIDEITLKDGDFTLGYATDDEDIIKGIEAICSGFIMISESYPDIVKVNV